MGSGGRRGPASFLLGVLLVLGGAGVRQVPGQPAPTAALGRLVRCEPVSRIVALQTRTGMITFVLAEDAVLREGVRNIELARVAAFVGRTAKVRFETVGGRRVARQLTIAAATCRHDRGTARPPEHQQPR